MLQPSLPISARPLASQIFIDSEGQLWTGRSGMYVNLASGGAGADDFVTRETFQIINADKDWLGKHHFTGALSIPAAPPVAPEAGRAYTWFGSSGSGSAQPPVISNLEDLQNVSNVIANGKFLYKNSSGVYVGVDVAFPDLSPYATKTWVSAEITSELESYVSIAAGDLRYITMATHQLVGADKDWTGRHHFTGALSIPTIAPASPETGMAYMWFGSSGSGGTPPAAISNLEDLQNVSNVVENGKFLYKNSSGIYVGMDAPVPDLSGYAEKTWVEVGFAPISHTHTIAQITGLQNALNAKEASFTKNTAFNKNFGFVAGTVAEGDDYRIIRGNDAFLWGNHALAGYLSLATADNRYMRPGTKETITGQKTFTSPRQTYAASGLRNLHDLATFIGGSTTPANNYFLIYLNHTLAAVMWEIEVEIYRYNSGAGVNDGQSTPIRLLITGYNAAAGSAMVNKSVYQTAGPEGQIVSVTYFREANNNIVVGIRVPSYAYPKVHLKKVTLHHNVNNTIADAILSGAFISSSTSTSGLTTVQTVLAEDINRQPNSDDLVAAFKNKLTAGVMEPSALIVPSAPPVGPESGKRYLWVN